MSSEKRKKSRIQGGWAKVVGNHPVKSLTMEMAVTSGSSFHPANGSPRGQNEDAGVSAAESLARNLIGKSSVASVPRNFTFQTDVGVSASIYTMI